jgi:hypothetical protein
VRDNFKIFIEVVLVDPVSGGDKGRKSRCIKEKDCGRGCGFSVDRRWG